MHDTWPDLEEYSNQFGKEMFTVMSRNPGAALTRRRFLTLMGLAASVGLLEACASTPAASPTTAPAAPAATKAPAAAPTSAPAAPAATSAPAAQPTKAPAASGTLGPKQTFIFAMQADASNVDPHVSVDGQSAVVANRCYDKLIELVPGAPKPGVPLEMRGDLAESWKVSDDGLKYTFKIRKGAKFSDGSPLDAKAVKWSFDRLMAVNKGAASNIRQLKSTEAPDESTVEMTLTEPYAYFLPTLASWQYGIVNPKVMDHQKNNDWGQEYLAGNIMGSGPYAMTEWRRGQQIQLDYNPNWWGKEPSIKRVIVKVVPETTNMRLQLEKGDVDFLNPISISETLTLDGKPGVRVVDSPSVWFILAYLNCTKPPLDNVKVRQAMSYAINYDALIKEVIKGRGRKANGPIAYGMEGYDETLKGYDYNPAKAKQLLAEAGFPNGFELLLTYAPAGAAGSDEVALASQADLAAVGIKVKIEKIAEPTRRERIDKNDFQWSIGSWTANPFPPQTMFRWYYSKNAGLNANRAFYSNPKVDELLLKAQTIMDDKQRIAMYQEAQRIVVEEAPYILYYQMNQVYAMRDNVEGFEWQPASSHTLFFERLSKK